MKWAVLAIGAVLALGGASARSAQADAAPHCAMDFNADTYTDIFDISMIAGSAFQHVPPADPMYDLNGDNLIDITGDIGVVAGHFGEQCVRQQWHDSGTTAMTLPNGLGTLNVGYDCWPDAWNGYLGVQDSQHRYAYFYAHNSCWVGGPTAQIDCMTYEEVNWPFDWSPYHNSQYYQIKTIANGANCDTGNTADVFQRYREYRVRYCYQITNDYGVVKPWDCHIMTWPWLWVP